MSDFDPVQRFPKNGGSNDACFSEKADRYIVEAFAPSDGFLDARDELCRSVGSAEIEMRAEVSPVQCNIDSSAKMMPSVLTQGCPSAFVSGEI